MATGFARYLRKTGCPAWGLLLYKSAVTLDVPLQMAAKGVEWLWRRLHGRAADAEKSWLVVRGLAAFVARGLPEFWRA